MELQLAFDGISVENALKITQDVKDLVDIIEMGTPFCYTNGAGVFKYFKALAPEVRLLADYKTMDGGYGMSKIAFDNGADIATVSGRTWDDTIKEAIQCAKEHGKQVLVDLMGTPADEIVERAKTIDSFGPDYLYLHRAVSVAGSTNPEEALKLIKGSVKHAKIGVAGGINLETLPGIVEAGPDLVIIGSAIYKSADPRDTILKMRAIMDRR